VELSNNCLGLQLHDIAGLAELFATGIPFPVLYISAVWHFFHILHAVSPVTVNACFALNTRMHAWHLWLYRGRAGRGTQAPPSSSRAAGYALQLVVNGRVEGGLAIHAVVAVRPRKKLEIFFTPEKTSSSR